MILKKNKSHFKNIDHFKEEIGLLPDKKEKPSKVIDIGEKYELVTGKQIDEACNLDSYLLPNLSKRWIPNNFVTGPYNDQLYKNSVEQEFYEDFIQPLFKIYKTGQFRKYMGVKDNIQTHQWEKKISLDALGPEKALFEKDNGKKRIVSLGEVEVTLILAIHFLEDIYKYPYGKIARRFGSSIDWVRKFKKKIQKAYGKMLTMQIDEHIENQLGRCEMILGTFIEKAVDGDPIAAKVVKDFMDKEDSYIMPTLDQLPAKETEEKRNETIGRLEKIFSDRKKIEFKK